MNRRVWGVVCTTLSILPSAPVAAQSATSLIPVAAPAAQSVAPAVLLMRRNERSAYIRSIDHQYYSFSVSGFRSYLESIREQEPHVYAALDSKVEDLETLRAAGRITFWGSLGGGLGLAILGIATTDDCVEYLSLTEGDEYDRCYDRESSYMTRMVLAGGAIAVVGMIVGEVLIPGRGDVRRLVNEHNAIAEDSPLELRVSLDASPTYAGLFVNARF